MELMKALSTPKRPRVPVEDTATKKLCRLSDNSDLIIYGETAEACQRHHEWLMENASTAEDFELRPRLLATAKERHDRLQCMTLPQALLEYPFLAAEQSLLLEFDLLFKKKICDEISRGFQRMCDFILRHGY
ncbi:hypothetical protein HPB52_017283 [Rhipicephalus sanguineus]|uniref:Uncharacterized protein n=1 Tax=Rhipicephalus sanguineus TaxID=34632 RepID=A0A9D4T1A0_RHISA|nr:hypothetical protein HPB52_017283 [Rhipicephalus sanguineus]